MTKASIADIINTIPLFSGMSEQEKSSLHEVARIRHFPRANILFLQGDQMQCFHIICRGTIQIFRETSEGHEITSDILISGEPLCITEVIEAQPVYKVSARAVEETMILEIPMQWLRQNLHNFNQLIFKLFANISHRLQKSSLELERQNTMSASELITCFLHELCVLYDFDPRGFELPYSKTLIASRLGMELETFSRSLHKLKEHGITVQGSHVSLFPSYNDNIECPPEKLQGKMLPIDLRN